MAQNEANGDYNSIQVSLRGATLKNDLTYQVGYTYSHTNDSFDGITQSDGDLYDVSNPYAGWKYDYGPSAFDIRSNFFANFVYRIPLLKDSAHPSTENDFGWLGDFGHRHRHIWCSTEYRIERSKRREYRSEYSQPSRREWHNE